MIPPFWVGEADLNDDFHDASHAVLEALRIGKTPLALTTDFVINETVTILGKRRGFGAKQARDVGYHMLSSPRVFVVFVDESILKEALKAYPKYGGKLSLTDTISVQVMRKYGSREIFSHDSDFDIVKTIKRRVSL